MIPLALRSVRADPARFGVTALAVGLSTLLVGSFATLLETALGPVTAAERETLVILGGVILGWGMVVGTFAPMSTVAVLIERRRDEIALLHNVGASHRQARRLLVAETAVVAALAAAAGALAAHPAGAYLLDRFADAGFVGPDVPYAAGPLSLGTTAALLVALACLAAAVATRRDADHVAGEPAATSRAGSAAATTTLGQAPPRLSRRRAVLGGVLLWSALSSAVTGPILAQAQDDPYLPMQILGPAGMLAAAGCAVLAPVLIRWAAPAGAQLLGTDPAGTLAKHSLAHRGRVLAPVLGPVIVLSATATGVLLLVGVDARTLVPPPDMTRQQADSITLLNVFVALMVSLFMAILAANALVAAVSSRRDEFIQLRLAGATPGQVTGLVTREALFVGGLGVTVGTGCAALTAVPFALARGEGVVPDGQLWLPGLVGALVCALTVAASRAAARGPSRAALSAAAS